MSQEEYHVRDAAKELFTRTWEGYCRGLKHSPTLTLSSPRRWWRFWTSLTGTVGSAGINGYLWRSLYYDVKGRVVQERASQGFGVTDKTNYAYDYRGNVMENQMMKESSIAKIIISFFLMGIICLCCGCSLNSPRVSLPSYTLLKEYSKAPFPYNVMENGHMGQYIVLNNNLQTYMSHAALQEEIGIWRMRGDTLFLEPQLFTSTWQKDPGMYHHIEKPKPRQFLMTKKYAIDITDRWQQMYDEAMLSSDPTEKEYYLQFDSLAIKKEKEWEKSSREVFLILQRSEPYKYQRSFDW